MHDHVYRNPLPPPSRMLANKHVLYLYVVCLCVPVNGGHPAIMCVKDGVTGWLDPYMLCVGPPEVYTHKPTHTHWVYVDQWYCFVTPQFSSSHVLVHLYLSLCETRPQHRKQLVTVNNVSLLASCDLLVSRLHFVHRIITVWYYSWIVTLQFSSSHFWRYSICISPFFETPQYPKQLATVTMQYCSCCFVHCIVTVWY